MKLCFRPEGCAIRRGLWLAAAATLACAAAPALAQYGIHSPVTSGERAAAQQVAARGVPVSELMPDAPEEYTVRRGDTLWGISGRYLKAPWHWPALWGMNLQQIHNPHLIYPGQRLFLERVGGRAFLRIDRSGPEPTVHVSPRNRVEMLAPTPISTLPLSVIGPFLAEPLVVSHDTFEHAPRIVALADDARVLISRGDRAYALGAPGAPLLKSPGAPTNFRIFRGAKPLKDPVTGKILGYEGQYVGQARLVSGQSKKEESAPKSVAISEPAAGNVPFPTTSKGPTYIPVPATIDIVSSKKEILPGDHLLPEPPAQYTNYTPHAPSIPVDARVISIYGDSVRFVGSNQIVAINKGTRDGIENGDVLAVLSSGRRMVDETGSKHETIQLPDERNGLAMVFKPFDRVSYVLITQASHPVQVGDKLVNPR